MPVLLVLLLAQAPLLPPSAVTQKPFEVPLNPQQWPRSCQRLHAESNKWRAA